MWATFCSLRLFCEKFFRIHNYQLIVRSYLWNTSHNSNLAVNCAECASRVHNTSIVDLHVCKCATTHSLWKLCSFQYACRLTIYAQFNRNHGVQILLCFSCPDMFCCSFVRFFFSAFFQLQFASTSFAICCFVCISEKFIVTRVRSHRVCGNGKIMRLIYWHIIGWLEYGNFLNAMQ